MSTVQSLAEQMDASRRTLVSWAHQAGEAKLMGDSFWVAQCAEMIARYSAILLTLKATHGDLGSLGHIDEHFGI